MESHGEEENDFTSVIENLVIMFGHVMSKEVIATLVESCEGDLNLSVDAIMKITNDGNAIPNDDDPSTNTNTETPPQCGATTSYAAQASQNKGAIPRQIQLNNKIKNGKPDILTDQIREIITHHNKGARIMIVMRGLPGSGKTYLAKSLINSMIGSTPTDYKTHIFSTDDYFMFRGQYQYDRNKLANAHFWNQNRVHQVTTQGLSPVIIDNTNVEVWEMHPYLGFGVANGYIIEIVEPNTQWAKKIGQLFKRSTHNVPLNTIKRMFDNFAKVESCESLLQLFRMSYPAHMIPPVMRLIPPVKIHEETSSAPDSEATIETIGTLPDCARNQECHLPSSSDEIIQEQSECSFNCSAPEENRKPSTENLVYDQIQEQVESNVLNEMEELRQEEQTKQNYVQEALKRLEELEKFEEEWENGEQWEETNQIAVTGTSSVITTNPAAVMPTDVATTSAENITSALINNLQSKPPRKDKKSEELDCESANNSMMQSVNKCQDWRDISLFMPSWVNPSEQPSITPTQEPPIETTTSSTCVEMYDTNLSGSHKVITATPRDINEYYIPPEREKIPEKRMLDKSTITDEGIIMTYHCPQKERHFVAFRNLFKNIERESLRYIFDNCCGDANWAVENIIGGGVEYKLKSIEEDDKSELEEESDLGNEQHCNCMAQYGITPNVSKFDSEPQIPEKEVTSPTPENTVTPLEKKKRDATISEENMQLKRQIEQNVVISDSHYSEHCLKIRKIRRGEHNKIDNSFDLPSTSGVTETASGPDGLIPTAPIVDYSDDDDDSDFCGAEPDKIINMNVGKTFIRHLDNMFGRHDMEYPDNISFNISMPNSVLNEINALWIESMMFQLDENAKRSEAMIKQDEEFARQLEMKEAELILAGKEPDVPDFKEIMDLDFALSLSLKDSTEWRKNVPTDIAAKMTHEKLYNLFPEIDKDILLEMLMAHDNNFKSTVEVLLTSTGHTDVLEQSNGVNKFIMLKEVERQGKLLQEKRETSDSTSESRDEINMATVQKYRDEAEKHLNHRNMHMTKAEDYIRRGMTQVANYWSDLANFHRTRYEHANSRAVSILMQYHAKNNLNGETVDLHYFRVKEAKEAMDLFIDNHIQLLKEKNKRSVTLFFITGRGLHSHGRPRVKPACIKRLRERGLLYSECNPGLLRSRVTCDSKLTYQLL